MNNAVYDAEGLIGFRCIRCGKVKDQMWGEICNECRHTAEENAKLRDEIRKLRKSISKR
jgi:hypothetical protein